MLDREREGRSRSEMSEVMRENITSERASERTSNWEKRMNSLVGRNEWMDVDGCCLRSAHGFGRFKSFHA